MVTEDKVRKKKAKLAGMTNIIIQTTTRFDNKLKLI